MQWLPLDRVNAWRDPVKITYRLPDAHSRQQIDQSWFTQTVCPTRGGEISLFCRVISFHRSMRINHGFKPRFDNSVLGGGEGRFTPMDSTGGDVLAKERRRKNRVIIWFPASISSILSRLESIDYFHKLSFIEFISTDPIVFLFLSPLNGVLYAFRFISILFLLLFCFLAWNFFFFNNWFEYRLFRIHFFCKRYIIFSRSKIK